MFLTLAALDSQPDTLERVRDAIRDALSGSVRLPSHMTLRIANTFTAALPDRPGGGGS
jgi:hypothetical protein